MRFVYGMIFGSFTSMVIGVAAVNAFPLSVESHPKYLQEHRARLLAEFDRDETANSLERNKLLLDEYRRKARDPIHPKGVDVPAADKIPAPAVPLPTAPVAPGP